MPPCDTVACPPPFVQILALTLCLISMVFRILNTTMTVIELTSGYGAVQAGSRS